MDTLCTRVGQTVAFTALFAITSHAKTVTSQPSKAVYYGAEICDAV